MKIKVMNKELSCFDKELKVVNMNYDVIVVKSGNEKVTLNKNDVKFIPENTYENTILECKDIIKIKIEKTMLICFYTALVGCIKEKINGEIKDIEVLKDEYSVIKKGFWEKKMILVINESIPLDINVIGSNYGKTYNIVIRDITIKKFLDSCLEEIEILKKEIDENQKLIYRYRKITKNIINNKISITEFESKKLISNI